MTKEKFIQKYAKPEQAQQMAAELESVIGTDHLQAGYWKMQLEMTEEEFKALKALMEEFKIPGATYTSSIREFILEQQTRIRELEDQLHEFQEAIYDE